MMDADRLKVPSSSDSAAQGDCTPSRRGHRHKRSFAISQDLDFLRQPPGTPQERSVHQTSSPVQHSDMSPRFFMSEESTFSHDVPNAIIDLDDALTTKPQSFTSHRRAESAPANLILPFKIEPAKPPVQPLRIEEEDSESDNEYVLRDSLMSPLRAKSQSPFLKNPLASTESPQPSRRSHYNNNALKINKQKERYLNYSKQLPAANSQIQTQCCPQEASSTSLSSDLTSEATTPAATVNTPNTPIFSVLKFSGRSPSPRKIFNFESQVYDLPSTDSAISDDIKDADDGNTLTFTVTNATYEPVHRRSKSAAACEVSEGLRIPKEILLGEPGGSVDLSKPVIHLRDGATPSSKLKKSLEAHTVSGSYENRSVSDSAVVNDKVSGSHSRRRGKLNILSSIFSRLKSSK
ncbi:LAQU0S15e00430g1_1 [Lachancea quebecensis]|uniref:LAQU0S15e00430g1_1 n=1 Tax=Lachancea quebecensis TaxID=1654605 RepID=A0A0P1KVG0_9SACH|nr:LAQU0S15e00430g1_1 [Lachancea quebecensis]